MLLENISLQQLNIDHAKIEFYMDEKKSLIEVISLRVPTKHRKRGFARNAMLKLINMADEKGLTIKLVASPLDKKTDPNKLVKFYQTLGFKVKDRANMAGDPWMIRLPNKS